VCQVTKESEIRHSSIPFTVRDSDPEGESILLDSVHPLRAFKNDASTLEPNVALQKPFQD
jgi:hypothetical protein